jgi:threonine synthase
LPAFEAGFKQMPTAYLQCVDESCRQRYALDNKDHVCACGNLLDVAYDFPKADPRALREIWAQRKTGSAVVDQSGVWRFRELLPFVPEGREVASLLEGRTPLIEARRTGEWVGGVHLAVKHQGNNPTGSFKDLGMTACITQAMLVGSRITACASTGNTSASMAAYAARAGMKAVVFVPFGKITTAKMAQALEFGAMVIEIGDNFDQAFQMLRSLAYELGLYLVNSVNPFRLEGQKTIACEILEQRDWRVPDYIVVPGGNLGNVSALGKGLSELRNIGIIGKFPRLVVTQASGASPFYKMLASGAAEIVPESEPRTEATAIRIGDPVNWKKALRAIRVTGGLCEAVTDEQIFEAKAALAKDGVGCEPASAASVAGLRKLVKSGAIPPGSEVVAILTGHQLKDPESGVRRRSEAELAQQRMHVEADAGKLRAALESVLLQSA